ncbi:MAG: protein kinase [Holophagaceae bacterium]|nr:protein kinase [Holophagaceae bacterium]
MWNNPQLMPRITSASPLKRVAWGLLFGVLSGVGAAAEPRDPARWARPEFQVTTSREGLPQNSVMGMSQDATGRLWVATQDGPAVFDGHAWKTKPMPDRNISNFVRCITLGNDGSLWFGRQDGGATRFRNGKWERPEGPMGAMGTRVNALLTHGSRIWAATARQGLGVFDGQGWRLLGAETGFPSATISSLAGAEGDSVWVGTNKGLALFEKGRVTRVELPGQNVQTLLRQKGGELLAGTSAGLFRKTGSTWESVKLPVETSGKSVQALAQTFSADGSPILWVGSGGGGLARLDGQGWQVLSPKEGLPSAAIWSLLPVEGPAGTEALWIGTDAGLVHVQFGQWQKLAGNETLATSIYGIALPQARNLCGTLWLGTRGGGVARVENGGVRFYTQADGLPDNTVFSLLEWEGENGQSVLYAGTQSEGLAQFRENRWSRVPMPPAARRINIRQMRETRDSDGQRVLWLITGADGLWRRTKDRWISTTVADGLPTNQLHCALGTSDDAGRRTLWIGTENGGLVRIRKGKVVTYTVREGLPNNTVMSLCESRRGGRHLLWAGTEGGGLVYLDPDDEVPNWRILSENTVPALPNNTIYQLQEDSQARLYAFTNRGVARISGPPGEFRIETFTTDSGLPSNEFNGGASMKDHLGRIWGGTIRGAVVFDPGQELVATAAPQLVLDQIRVNGEARNMLSGARLGYRERRLEFSYSLLGYFRSTETRYQTQLLGLEEAPSNWVEDPHREFPGLGAGNYIFRVRAKDYQGRVVGPVDVAFEIHPAPWRTVWAYLLYAVSLAGAVWFAIRTRLRRLLRKNEELEAKIRLRTAEIEAAKDQIEAQNHQISRLMESSSLAQRDLISWSRAIAGELAQTIGATSIGILTVQGEELRQLGESDTRIPTLQELQAQTYLNPDQERRKHTVTVAVDRRRELSIPVKGPSGEILGGMVLSGPFRWGDAERRLVGVVAAQLGAVLELQKTRRSLNAARHQQAQTREKLREKGVSLLQTCPSCGRCYDESVQVCMWDSEPLESPRILPFVVQERYQLTRLLGEGGMGLVFEAKDLRLGRDVALKLIKPELYGIAEIRARFAQEARALAGIEHPSVISIFDSGELDDGSAFMVMELLKGVDLGTLITRHGPGTPAQVARLLRQGAAGLAAVHRTGVVHRDLKPANIFLIPNGQESNSNAFQVKILDFGLAKPLAAEGGVTQTGMVVGTPHYMSPEQVRGQTLDARCDVYAFAANGYEALTGRRLISPTAVADIFSLITRGEHMDLRELLPGLPARVEEAFAAALAVDPTTRPWDIEAWATGFAAELETMKSVARGWPDLSATETQLLDTGTPPTGRMPDAGSSDLPN